MERRKKVRSRLSLSVAVALTGALFYSMLTWSSASAADNAVGATLAGGFDPDPVSVASGDTITWTNNDTAAVGNHDLVADGDLPTEIGFIEPCTIGPGESCDAIQINPLPGTYGYHCDIHPTMTGSIVVTPMGGGGGSPSGSASGSPSGSASPSSSPSASPSGSASPTASPSASTSPSPSPEPQVFDRIVSLNLKKHLTAKGTVNAEDGAGGDACIDDVKVTIQKKKKKRGWKKVDTTRTNSDGKYSVKIPDKEGKYRAKIAEETVGSVTCLGDKSETEQHKHGNGKKGRARRR
jgi:plastocyanin